MPYLLRGLAAPGVGRIFRRVGAKCCFLAGVGGCGTVFGREVGKLGAWTSEEVAVIVEDEDSSSDVAVEVHTLRSLLSPWCWRSRGISVR